MNQAPTATPALTRRWPPGATVNLDGTGSSDPDAGDTLDYAWTQTGGTAVTLTGAEHRDPELHGADPAQGHRRP